MVQLNRRWAPHRSEGNLSCMTTLFDTSSLHFNVQHLTSSLPPLYTPFLHSLSTYSTLSIDQPPFDTPSLHSVMVQLNRRQKSTHPVWLPPFDTSSLPPLYTPFLHPLSTYYPIWLNPLFTLPLPYISSSPNCHSLSLHSLFTVHSVPECGFEVLK